jgi:dTDP-4-dehydrorhamnose reductase
MLGTDLCPALSGHGHEVIGIGHGDVDVCNRARVAAVMDEVRPQLVYHLAALTDVDRCEREPDAAYQVNALGTQIVALECLRTGAEMVLVSTISVFDGEKPEPYTEFDRPNPPNTYARSKYAGERFVRHLLPRSYICRAGWMVGGGHKDKKFVAKIVELARERPELSIVDDKFGSPTYTLDFSRAIIALAESGLYGAYHAVNSGGPCSRYEYAQAILEFAGINTCRLMPVGSAQFPLPATRPRMEAAYNRMFELHRLPPMRPWRVALREYVEAEISSHGG